MPSASKADQELVQRLIDGDEKSFSALVDQYHGQLLRLCRAFVKSDAVAEEVVQETWMAVLKGIKSFQGRSSLKTWIFTILTNQAKTRGVKEGRSIPFSNLAGDEAAVEPERFKKNGRWADPPKEWSTDAPDAVFLRKEALHQLEGAIAKLPENQRVVVTLRDIQGCTSVEVCNLLEITESNQRVLLHRGRSRIRQALETYMADK